MVWRSAFEKLFLYLFSIDVNERATVANCVGWSGVLLL